MRFVKIENDKINYTYTLDNLFEEYPNAIIYNEKSKYLPSETLLKKYNVYPLITTPKPDGDVITEITPIKKNGEWHQRWESRYYTEEEKSLEEERPIEDLLLRLSKEI